MAHEFRVKNGLIIASGDITPDASGAQDIGTVSLAFDEAYIDKIYLESDPITPLQAVTKQYVDNAVVTANEFIELTDTPSSYAGMAASGVRVNSSANGLEFYHTTDADIDTLQTVTDRGNTTTNSIGIGSSSPQSALHILTAGSEITPPSSTALTLQRSSAAGASVYQTLISGNAGDTGFWFGDTDDNDRAGILYRHASDDFVFYTSDAARLTLDSTSLDSTVPFRGSDGSVGTPSISFVNDPDTGFYNGAGSHDIYLAVGGGTACYWAYGSSVWYMANHAGSSTVPGYTFMSDTNTGMYLVAGGALGFTVSTVPVAEFRSSYVVFNEGGADIDFRIESNGDANAFLLDAGANEIKPGVNIIPDASGALDLGSISYAFASGYIDELYLEADPIHPLQAATKQYVDIQASGVTDHRLLSNLAWSVADHTIDANIVPTASGTIDLGTVVLAFNDAHIDNIYSNDLYISGASLHIGGIDITSDGVNITFSGGLMPDASGTKDIGSISLAYDDAYIDKLYLEADPTTPLQAATKQYVDTQVGSIVESDTLQIVTDRGNTTTNDILVNSDADTVGGVIACRAKVGMPTNGVSDYAYFGHLDHFNDNVSYAMAQGSAGDTYISAETGQNLQIIARGTTDFKVFTGSTDEMLTVYPTGFVFNEAGNDADIRIESLGNSNFFFLEGSEDKIGIGTNTPARQLDLFSATDSSLLGIRSNGATAGGLSLYAGGSNSGFVTIGADKVSGSWIAREVSGGTIGNQAGSWLFYDFTGATIGNAPTFIESLLISPTGYIFNETGRDADFRIESTGSPYMFNIDSGNDRVGIHELTPDRGRLHITGNTTTGYLGSSTVGFLALENENSNAGSMQFWVAPDAAGGTITFSCTPTFVSGGVTGLTAQYPGSGRNACAIESYTGDFKIHMVNTSSVYHVPLNINGSTGNIGIGMSPDGSAKLSIGQNSDTYHLYGDGTDWYQYWSDGSLYFMTDEGTHSPSILWAKGKGASASGGYAYVGAESDANFVNLFGGNASAAVMFDSDGSLVFYGQPYADRGTINNLTGALLSISPAEIVVNDTAADVDFRVEGVGEANALFVQGSDGYVGFGTNLPAIQFSIVGRATSNEIIAGLDDSAGHRLLDFGSDASSGGHIGIRNASQQVVHLLDGVGGVVWNDQGADMDFRVESNIGTHSFFLQGSDGYIGMYGAGMSTPPSGRLTLWDNNNAQAGQSIFIGNSPTADYALRRNTSDGYFEILGTQTGFIGYRLIGEGSDYFQFINNGSHALQSWNDGALYLYTSETNTDTWVRVRGNGAGGAHVQVMDSTEAKYCDISYDESDSTIDFNLAGVSEICINEGGIDVNFRVESLGDTSAFFIDAGANEIKPGVNIIPDASGALNIGSIGYAFNDAHINNVYLGADPIDPLQAVTKQYVDDIIQASGISGWQDDGPVVRLTNVTNNVNIGGTSSAGSGGQAVLLLTESVAPSGNVSNAVQLYAETGENPTVLMCHMDGIDGQYEIRDWGNTGHVITRVNTAQISIEAQKWGDTSCYFDGTTDYLTIPDSADWDLMADRTTDWTVEVWVKHIDHDGTETYIAQGEADSNDDIWELGHIDGTGLRFRVRSGNATKIDMNGGEITDTDWHHVALIRKGGATPAYGVYLDGVQVSFDDDTWEDTYAAILKIGTETTGSLAFEGYMDEIRIIEDNPYGAAPAVGLTDTITVPTGPFTSDANTKLLLHFETLDYSGYNNIPTFVGSAQLDVDQKQWGESSLLLDGNSDSITFPAVGYWSLIANPLQNITIDFWVRFSVLQNARIVGQGTASNNEWTLEYIHGSGFRLLVEGNTTISTGYTGVVSADTWYHIALIKWSDSGSAKYGIYIDGTQLAYVASNNVATWDAVLRIGCNPSGGSTLFMAGWIDDFRICSYNVFNAAPNATMTDTITIPTEAHADDTSGTELKVRDEIGNVTTLSPHNFSDIPYDKVLDLKKESDDMAWTYHSEKDGKSITVDMWTALRELEKLSGKKLIYLN